MQNIQFYCSFPNQEKTPIFKHSKFRHLWCYNDEGIILGFDKFEDMKKRIEKYGGKVTSDQPLEIVKSKGSSGNYVIFLDNAAQINFFKKAQAQAFVNSLN